MAKYIDTRFDIYVNEGKIDGYIYHGTGKGQAKNIQNDGFMKPNNTGEGKPSISFTDDIDYAKYYAISKSSRDNMVILRIEKDDRFKLSPRIKNNSGTEYITFDEVKSNELEVLSKDGNWYKLDEWNVIFDEPKN